MKNHKKCRKLFRNDIQKHVTAVRANCMLKTVNTILPYLMWNMMIWMNKHRFVVYAIFAVIFDLFANSSILPHFSSLTLCSSFLFFLQSIDVWLQLLPFREFDSKRCLMLKQLDDCIWYEPININCDLWDGLIDEFGMWQGEFNLMWVYWDEETKS